MNCFDKLRFVLIAFLMVLGSSSCKEAQPLPLNVMSKILLKMHLAESYAQALPKRENSTVYKDPDSLLKHHAVILDEHRISKEEFEKSLNYYKKHPDLLDSIYQLILADVAILQAKNSKK
jgi:Domain of unknown function (DUF4296)